MCVCDISREMIHAFSDFTKALINIMAFFFKTLLNGDFHGLELSDFASLKQDTFVPILTTSNPRS